LNENLHPDLSQANFDQKQEFLENLGRFLREKLPNSCFIAEEIVKFIEVDGFRPGNVHVKVAETENRSTEKFHVFKNSILVGQSSLTDFSSSSDKSSSSANNFSKHLSKSSTHPYRALFIKSSIQPKKLQPNPHQR